MGKKTGISWCDHTFNPWWGCTKISAGCDNCYAATWSKRTGFDVFGADKPRRFFGDKHWNEPILWDAAAAAAGVRRRVFCGSMCDVFEVDKSAEHQMDHTRDALWHLIDNTPNLDWLLLTKRPENFKRYTPSHWCGFWCPDCDGKGETIESLQEAAPCFECNGSSAPLWPRNVWALTTVENQDMAPVRTWPLLVTPAPIRGLSIEPLLGPIWLPGLLDSQIHWIIIGCEKLAGNRPGRPCDLAWVRSLVIQGRNAGIAVFVKQLAIDGRVSADPADWPEDLRIQELPT